MAFASLGDGDMAAELFSMLNPITHSTTRAGVHRYKVEPYVMAADVYSEFPHVGRGGWTWYTGSAGWMYQAAVGSILGFRLRGQTLSIDPCIPRAWPGFRIDFRYGSARYAIVVDNPDPVSRGVVSVELDGVSIPGPGATITLADDGRSHSVRIVLGIEGRTGTPMELQAAPASEDDQEPPAASTVRSSTRAEATRPSGRAR
jgi:cyclic beta-1,2-glucan synthetase